MMHCLIHNKTLLIALVVLLLFFLSLACSIPALGGGSANDLPPIEISTQLPEETDQPSDEPLQTTDQATAPTQQPQEDLEAALILVKDTYQPGEEIQVQFTAPAGFSGDAWVGIIPSNTPHGSEVVNDENDVESQFINGATSGTMIFTAPATPGNYDLRMFDTDTLGQEVAAISFLVEDMGSNDVTVSFSGVSFRYDPSLAASVFGETVSASDPADSFDIYPAHTRFNFTGYILSDTFHTPRILVYPVDEYQQANEYSFAIIASLQQLLDSENPDPENIPFLPSFHAAQVFNSNVRYLDFVNGKGVRFVTQYAQAYVPINNQEIFYTFQGLTNDGRFYISAILPVSNPSLPADGQISAEELQTFANDFETYIVNITTQLDAQPDSSFTPNLTYLDQMMQSLEAY